MITVIKGGTPSYAERKPALRFQRSDLEKNRREYGAGELESFFVRYRKGIIGQGCEIETPYGRKRMIYADWTASGKLYAPIEKRLTDRFGPYVANTHTESNLTGSTMSQAYAEAVRIIRRHVRADDHDVVLTAGSGMTDVVNKLQRILGMRVPDGIRSKIRLTERERPVIFLTHMEHHSNHISWMETIGDVVILPPGRDGQVDPDRLKEALPRFRERPLKIGAFTACSNVTGIVTPYRKLARVMHEHGGVCFIDFSASAPYAEIDMHPAHPLEKLDAIYFSPHKCLGGPGTSGVLVFDRRLYRSRVPDHPGGGTVLWTDPWGRVRYWDDIEAREDGGTPGFLQTIRTALCLKLKERMGTERIEARKNELLMRLWGKMAAIPGVHLLEPKREDRMAIVSFWMERVPYSLAVRLLNDRFGIQVRGGCSCAGTYGHYLFGIGKEESDHILKKVEAGDFSAKPGWVRISLHPVMEDAEVDAIGRAVEETARYGEQWAKEYDYDPGSNEYRHRTKPEKSLIGGWFDLEDFG